MHSVAHLKIQTLKSPWRRYRIVYMTSRHNWVIIISVFVETGLIVMFGRPELFNECLVALWPPPPGSSTGPYIQTHINSTFRFDTLSQGSKSDSESDSERPI